MGSVHKFKPPPKNQKQFRGYRPQGGGKPPRGGGWWQRLRPWQRSVVAWAILIATAAGFVLVPAFVRGL